MKDGMKYCCMGKHHAPIEDFGIDNRAEDGLTCSCLPCRRERYKGKYKSAEYISGIDRPDFTQMRHPDPAVMEAKVRRLVSKYAVNRLLLAASGLSFDSPAEECDKALIPATSR